MVAEQDIVLAPVPVPSHKIDCWGFWTIWALEVGQAEELDQILLNKIDCWELWTLGAREVGELVRVPDICSLRSRIP